MTSLLQLNSSILGEHSQSSRLAADFVAAWQAREPALRVLRRDLAAEPIPHLDGARFAAFLSQPEERSAEQQAVVEFSDRLIAELRAADVVVLGLPTYNLGVPSQLKAYFDHIARAGVTFRYTEQGPVGLLAGKKVYVFATRGGRYAGTPQDSATSQVQSLLGLLGLRDIEFVYAEGLAISAEAKQAALAAAQAEIGRLHNDGIAAAA